MTEEQAAHIVETFSLFNCYGIEANNKSAKAAEDLTNRYNELKATYRLEEAERIAKIEFLLKCQG